MMTTEEKTGLQYLLSLIEEAKALEILTTEDTPIKYGYFIGFAQQLFLYLPEEVLAITSDVGTVTNPSIELDTPPAAEDIWTLDEVREYIELTVIE